MNVVSGSLRAFILGYRYLVSPLLPPCCRFYPSCSDYALQALTHHGALTGIWLTLRRLGRCHPFGGSGYDPVPDARPVSVVGTALKRPRK